MHTILISGNEPAHALLAVPVLILKQDGPTPDAIIADREKVDDDIKAMKNFIRCRTCGNIITSEEQIISINGAHEHTFMNPRGIVFQIGCFAQARGCFIMGVPTTEYTWFTGFAWRYIICAECQAHLGWHYQSEGSQFYGLILENLSRD